MSESLFDYYFHHDGMFLIPIEHLSAEGVDKVLADEILKRGRMSEAALARLNQAYNQYWLRAESLHQRAGQFWYPPRVQHLCIVTRPGQVRPFFQPFNRNSWLLYQSDFEPETSSVELATYLFLHVERMVMLQQILPALYFNLSYFLTLSTQQAEDFQAGCRKCKRPDAGAFRALGKNLTWVRQLYHQPLKPPTLAIPGSRVMPDCGLVLTADTHRKLGGLQQSFATATQGLINRYRRHFEKQRTNPGAQICQWLSEAQARLVLTDGEGGKLWDPEAPGNTERIGAVLASVTEQAEESILQDLQVVDARSRSFLESLTCPEELVDPAPHITEGGLSYIHRERKLIAYSIGSGENQSRLWEPAPPYERLMLGARTIHEWGHLAAESNWVRVPGDRLEERDAIRSELASLFDQIHAAAPPAIKAQAAQEVAALQARAGSLGEALLKAVAIRVEDYMSNLLARCFLPADEMDTYVRNNVCSHVQDYTQAGIFMQLARQTYEFQYLGLSRIADARDWFIKSTWLDEQFVRPGLISLAQFDQLAALVGRLCGLFEIDPSKFSFSASPPDTASPGQ